MSITVNRSGRFDSQTGAAIISGTVTCTHGDLSPAGTWTVSVTVSVPADLVFNNGVVKVVSAFASAMVTLFSAALDDW